MRRVVGILAGFSLLVLLSVFEQLMGLLTDKDEKTVVYKMTKEQNRPIIVLIVDNPEVFHVSSPYEVIIIIREQTTDGKYA